MTPLVQESLATMATINATQMSPPPSPKRPQQPPNPSPSSSGTASKLFRPWRPAEGLVDREEERKGDKPKVQEESTRRRRKEDREARKNKKRAEERSRKVEGQDLKSPTSSAQAPAWETPADPLRIPSKKPRDEDGDVLSASALSSSSPSLSAPQSYGRHLPQDPHLVHPSLHHLFHPQQPLHPLAYLPPHLDPVLLAEMTDAELERLGLLGGYDTSLTACGGAHDSRGLSNPSGAAGGKKQRPKKYRCPHCQVAFSNNGQLRGHVRIHTGERPFSCEYEGCGKAFTRNEELTRHRRIHSGQRPFACPLCEKRFGRKDHLKKHARTHAPPPPSPHPHAYLLAHGADPRLLLPPPLAFSPHHGLLVGAAAGGVAAAADADPLSSQPAQRIAEMAALAGFPYLYGY